MVALSLTLIAAVLAVGIAPQPAAAAATERFKIEMPFANGKWAYDVPTNRNCGNASLFETAHPSCHALEGGGHWSTDLYAAAGTTVKLHLSEATGQLSYEYVSGGPGSCGTRLVFKIKVDAVWVGWVYIDHLDNAVTTSAQIFNGAHLGTVRSKCYGTDHIHFEVKNLEAGYACYFNHSNASFKAGVPVDEAVGLGVLGAKGTVAHQDCATIPPDPPTGGGQASPDYNHDGFSDLYQIHANSTGSGKVEVHILSGISFQVPLADLATAANPRATADVAFLAGDYNHDSNLDLYQVIHDHTGSGRTEVHILAGPNFQHSLGSWATPWSVFPASQAQFRLGDYNRDGFPDLYLVLLSGTGSGKVEVHILSGTNFQSGLGGWATIANSWLPDQTQALLGDYNRDEFPDLYQVVQNRTGSNRTEVHILNGTNFQSGLGSWATIAGTTTPGETQVAIGDFNHDGKGDLYQTVLNGTGSNRTEVHILTGTNFQASLGDWATIATTGNASYEEVILG